MLFSGADVVAAVVVVGESVVAVDLATDGEMGLEGETDDDEDDVMGVEELSDERRTG